jgi:hypothetical protein
MTLAIKLLILSSKQTICLDYMAERRRKRKTIFFTSLFSECPDGNHNKCRITYFNKYKSNTKEMCMCRCHSHASPSSTRQEDHIEQEIGIGKLFS